MRALPRARLPADRVGDRRGLLRPTRRRTTHVDHKTELRKRSRSGRSVTYAVLDVEGPAHDRHFSCAAQIDGEELGEGHRPHEKEAEQAAAKQALAAIGAESSRPADAAGVVRTDNGGRALR